MLYIWRLGFQTRTPKSLFKVVWMTANGHAKTLWVTSILAKEFRNLTHLGKFPFYTGMLPTQRVRSSPLPPSSQASSWLSGQTQEIEKRQEEGAGQQCMGLHYLIPQSLRLRSGSHGIQSCFLSQPAGKKKKIKPQLCNPRRKGQPLVGVSGRLREAHHPPTHMPPTQLQSQGPLLAWQDTMQSVSHH